MEKLRKLQQHIGEYVILKERKEDFDTVLDCLQGDYPEETACYPVIGGATIPLNAYKIRELVETHSEANDKLLDAERKEVKTLLKVLNKKIK